VPKSTAATAALRDWLLTGAVPQISTADAASALADAAAAHGLTALLDSAGDAAWPAAVRRQLREGHQRALAEAVQKLALAQRATAVLARAGVRALPLKGAAVAETLYDSPAERPMEDVDLLVLDEWTDAVRAVSAAGFRELERADHAWSFADPITGFALELHRGITSCPGLHPIDAHGLWSRSVPGTGQVGRGPSAPDLLAQLSMHAAFQHGLALRLGQYLDFRRLLERIPPDPSEAFAVARTAHAESAVAVALEAAAVVVGAPVPDALRAAFEPYLSPPLARCVRGHPHSRGWRGCAGPSLPGADASSSQRPWASGRPARRRSCSAGCWWHGAPRACSSGGAFRCCEMRSPQPGPEGPGDERRVRNGVSRPVRCSSGARPAGLPRGLSRGPLHGDRALHGTRSRRGRERRGRRAHARIRPPG
jgi:hypothetical protein